MPVAKENLHLRALSGNTDLGASRMDSLLANVGSRTDSGTRGISSIGEIILDKLDEVDCSVGE